MLSVVMAFLAWIFVSLNSNDTKGKTINGIAIDMQQVDDFLEPLTEDYIMLYKENSVLKAKMKILVGWRV